MNTIKVVNMTEFFSRELMLYSLGDLRFRKPKSLKKACLLYTSDAADE